MIRRPQRRWPRRLRRRPQGKRRGAKQAGINSVFYVSPPPPTSGCPGGAACTNSHHCCSRTNPFRPRSHRTSLRPARQRPPRPPLRRLPPPAARTVRIKAGKSEPVKDADGNVWLADQGFEGGQTIERPDIQVGNTKSPDLYRAERYSMDSFSWPVPNGKYVVKLHFAETFDGINGPGERVFSFNVQGHEFKDFDVWVKTGGPMKAYVETIPIEVTDGKIKVTFTPKVENPQICAIEIIPQGGGETSTGTSAPAAKALAADVTGTWKAEFDTQIGMQKYTFVLKQDGATLTGKASADINGEKHEAELKEGKIDGDSVSFVEMLNFQGNDLRIVYTGKVLANEIKFTRQVGEFAKEDLVAKREGAATPAQPATTQPAAGPGARRGGGRGGFGGPVNLSRKTTNKPFRRPRKVLTKPAKTSPTANLNGLITTPRPSASNGGWRCTLRPAIPKTRSIPFCSCCTASAATKTGSGPGAVRPMWSLTI